MEFKCGIIPKTLKIRAQAKNRGYETINISLVVSFWFLRSYNLKHREHCFRHNKEDKEAIKQQSKTNKLCGHGKLTPPELQNI